MKQKLGNLKWQILNWKQWLYTRGQWNMMGYGPGDEYNVFSGYRFCTVREQMTYWWKEWKGRRLAREVKQELQQRMNATKESK